MAEVAVDFLLGHGFSSRLIGWFGGGGYSHAASVLSDGRYLDSRSNVIDGVPAGVHIRHPASELSIKRTRAILTVTPTEASDWEASLRAKIGTPYAHADIIGFITGRSLHVAGQWDCSALAVNALQHIKKLPYPLPIAAHSITPNALILLMAAIGARIVPTQTLSK